MTKDRKTRSAECCPGLDGQDISAWDVFDRLPVSAALLGPDCRIRRVNRKWREFAVENGIDDPSGLCEGADYLAICRCAALAGEDLALRAMEGIKEILSGASDHFEMEYPCHSPGIKRWFVMECKSASAGHVITLHFDITKRKMAEDALAESERKYRLIAENSDDVFWIGTPGAGKIVYVSPAYEKVWGRDREQLYADPRAFFETMHPDDRSLVAESRGGNANGSWNLQYRILRPDGTVRWIHDRGFPVHDSQGRLVLMTGVAADITERKRMEDEIKRSRDQLEVRVQERTRSLEEAVAALRFLLKQRDEDRHESREAVLANIRHSILPYLEKLKGYKLPEEAATYLDLIELKINEIASSFVKTLSDKFLDLTPMEIRVGELIRDGRSTKEISALLNVSPGTIRYHRENLRQKLGIKGKAFNLQILLKNLS